MKARRIEDAKKFEDIPNVGPRVANDFKRLGFKTPQSLRNIDPLQIYKRLCQISKTRQDPCVLDVFIAVTEFANGGESKPWWFYTSIRKSEYPNI